MTSLFAMCLGLLLFGAPQQDKLFDHHLATLKADFGSATVQQQVMGAAKLLAGIQYKDKTLEGNQTEQLVVRLDAFDCVTYVESVLALVACLQNGESTYADYQRHLTSLRYRSGKIDGYPSRLHYSCDWAFDNGLRGNMHDVTKDIGGELRDKEISFMSRHRSAYAALAEDDANLAAIKTVEADINTREYYFIPEARLRALENKIQDGDVLALTTKIEHLDIAHLGFAVHVKGRLHLLHASSKHGKVLVSPETLEDMLKASSSRNGVMVFRPLAAKHAQP